MFDLAICLSTKNRVTNLNSTLKCLFSNKGINKEKIQITIVDATLSSNYLNVKNYNNKPKNFYINYIHDPKDSGGLDAAYDKAVRFSDSKYVYLASDDDFISDNFIINILEKIKLDKDLYILNTDVCDANLDQILQKNRLSIQKDFEITFDKNKRIIPNTLLEQLSYIGSILIKRENWINYNSSKYFKSYFSHLSNIFDSKEKIEIYIISEIYVKCRIDAESWSKKHLTLWNFYWPQMTKMISHGFCDLNKSEIIDDIKLKILIKYYALGILDELDSIKLSSKLKFKINLLKMINKKIIIYICLLISNLKKNQILKYRLKRRLK